MPVDINVVKKDHGENTETKSFQANTVTPKSTSTADESDTI